MVIHRKKQKKSRTVRLNRAKNKLRVDEQNLSPHSFVIHRGTVTIQQKHLIMDFRKVMAPFTASSLQVKKKNSMKDFVSVAGLLHVSHLCAFTCTEYSQYLKLCRLPRGPTLTFRIHNYTLASDVVSSIRKQYVLDKLFDHAPLVVLNGFSGEGEHLKLMSTMFQNLFPTINLTKVNLSSIRRCLLLNYIPETGMIDFRHYAIKVAPTGVSKGVKKMLQNKVPDLSRFKDMSEFMMKSGLMSDSEGEDDPNSHVIVPQHLKFRGCQLAEKSAIRLHEIGPRMSIELMKVEEGLMAGDVLYHKVVKKTDEEVEAARKKREAAKKLKEQRRKEQNQNMKKKEKEKEDHKLKSLEGIEQKRQQLMEEQKKRQPAKKINKDLLETDILMRKAVLESQAQDSDDDDAEWYRKEVGEEPEKDLFDAKRKSSGTSGQSWKKPRLDKQHMGRFNRNTGGSKKKLTNGSRSKDRSDTDRFQGMSGGSRGRGGTRGRDGSRGRGGSRGRDDSSRDGSRGRSSSRGRGGTRGRGGSSRGAPRGRGGSRGRGASRGRGNSRGRGRR
ncbi:suppressor of SWI4 1 homolog [Thrips palmi]|uniref:Suppressor of SWI4 1 homolog n=1 Tax=Thrips palmi TaxID=161013 RepID=A0A6P9A0F1_THRPL|nr:suppressor of SWI4 1 homolog [Thrips palmi]